MFSYKTESSNGWVKTLNKKHPNIINEISNIMYNIIYYVISLTLIKSLLFLSL